MWRDDNWSIVKRHGRKIQQDHLRKFPLKARTILNVLAIIGATFGFLEAPDGGAGTETEADAEPDPKDPDFGGTTTFLG